MIIPSSFWPLCLGWQAPHTLPLFLFSSHAPLNHRKIHLPILELILELVSASYSKYPDPKMAAGPWRSRTR